ncbi:Choline transport protein [Cladobotryum mycophilum]|uniref:Choline transport protein n=1 Tax=Cladobotryum mycophilum TaxID=491253 RepID=A0ABR0SW51_9HYPO
MTPPLPGAVNILCMGSARKQEEVEVESYSSRQIATTLTARGDQHGSQEKDSKDTKEVLSIDNGAVLESNVDLDDAVLRANGHESTLARQFSWISALALGFNITNSWVGYLSNFGQSLVYGGPQVALFGLLVAFVAQFLITIGLSEIASAFPSTGGQYHFCYILSPQKAKRFTAYIIGWMSTIAWWTLTCSGISLAAITLPGIINFFDHSFVAKQWHIYLFYLSIAVITLIPLFIASRKLSLIVQFSLALSIFGFFIWLFTAVGMHEHTQPGSFLIQPSLGTSGWSDGTAWVLGVSNCMYAYGGTDGAIHISEEIHQPGRRVPQVIAMTLVIGLVTSFSLFLALMYFMIDLHAVSTSPLPSIELIYQATGNKNVTVFLVAWLLAVYITCLPAQWVTSGRLAWAFARDNGVPYSSYFSHIDPRLGFPVRTTIAAFVFVCIYGLLYLASTTAFNSIITSAVLYLNITYAVPQVILLFKGRNQSLPPRYLNLGWLGYVCNAFAVLWVVVLGVFICMPPSLPVAAGSMNYTSVVAVSLFVIVLVLWVFSGRHSFEGPEIDWELLRVANVESLKSSAGAGPASKAES